MRVHGYETVCEYVCVCLCACVCVHTQAYGMYRMHFRCTERITVFKAASTGSTVKPNIYDWTPLLSDRCDQIRMKI